jgi:hypothetical protein
VGQFDNIIFRLIITLENFVFLISVMWIDDSVILNEHMIRIRNILFDCIQLVTS